MAKYSGYLGFIRLSGSDIQKGVLGARETSELLLGFDSSLRYFLIQKDSELAGVDFEIPVRIREGSLEALIPQTIAQWITDGSAIVATTFLSQAANQVASNTFKDKDLKAVVRDSMRLMKGVVRIAKHVGTMGNKDVAKGAKFVNDNREIEIANDDEVLLRTTVEELEAYLRTPSRLLEEVVQVVGEHRTMSIGVVDEGGASEEENITYSERHIFAKEEDLDDNEVLFPELVHGEQVSLEGSVTRGNKRTNTIGFEYKGHILTCSPLNGNITDFKEALFRDCTIVGTVSRHRDPMLLDDKRPRIVFQQLIPLANEKEQTSLL